MKLSDFDFEFDESLIALRPSEPRTSSRLLVQNGPERSHAHFIDLPSFLKPGDLLVFNDTKVIPARLFGMRSRGDITAKVEVTLISDAEDRWTALARPARKLRAGDVIKFSRDLTAEVLTDPNGGEVALTFSKSGSQFFEALAQAGVMPLPPYIAARRNADEKDRETYQTVFARHDGAIAAPTASLHFDEALLRDLKSQGVHQAFVTLHVGIGTFLPVKVDDISDHKMHAEWGEVTDLAAQKIADTKKNGGRVIPVGTTSLRLLETAARSGSIKAWTGDTDIFITPGFEFQVADGLITNFHLPKSTLMMLVSALMGADVIRDIYSDAIDRKYRFFSYGDGSLLIP